MMPAPMPADVEERASAHNLQHDVDISQSKASIRRTVGTSVNGRYETGEDSATQSGHTHLSSDPTVIPDIILQAAPCMLEGQGGHILIDIRPHHREAFSAMAKDAMIRSMRRNSARPWRRPTALCDNSGPCEVSLASERSRRRGRHPFDSHQGAADGASRSGEWTILTENAPLL
jgi:hypothetical protein